MRILDDREEMQRWYFVLGRMIERMLEDDLRELGIIENRNDRERLSN
jgi:hypothetical protein